MDIKDIDVAVRNFEKFEQCGTALDVCMKGHESATGQVALQIVRFLLIHNQQQMIDIFNDERERIKAVINNL